MTAAALRPPKPGETPGSVEPDDARPQPIWLHQHHVERVDLPGAVDVADQWYGVNADLPVDHPFRSLNGAHRCVAIVGPLNSGEACGLPPEDHQPSTVTGS